MHFLAVVAKRPAAGQTKTRLCPPLSGAAAAELYEHFLQDTLQIMRAVPGVERSIVFLPETERSYFAELAPDMTLLPQRGADLGVRLDNLLSDALANGATAAVVMDSDSPTLPPALVEEAFVRLDAGDDVVLGPCDDGGYYLIGLRSPQPRLTRDVTMSTATVLQDTLAIAAGLGLRVHLLPVWYDVDTAAELERLHGELRDQPAGVAAHTRRWFSRWNGGAG
jgi:rSAM/selenodomain-associated transferase 1